MARVGAEEYDNALTKPHVREMDFTGKPMTGYVFVDTPGIEHDAELFAWIEQCHRYIKTLPPKKPK